MFTLAYICSFRYISELNMGFYFICDSDSQSVSLPPSLSLSHSHRHTHKLFPIGTKKKKKTQTGNKQEVLANCVFTVFGSQGLCIFFPLSLSFLDIVCGGERQGKKGSSALLIMLFTNPHPWQRIKIWMTWFSF